jgi:hypothetical protein
LAQNLGANRQALSEDDFSEESAGWYWQFNRKQGYKHDGLDRTPNTSWELPCVNGNWTPENDPCTLLLGAGWRIPTNTEWELALSSIIKTSNADLYKGVLKLHRGGRLLFNGTLTNRGTEGQFASRNQGANSCLTYKVLYSLGGLDGDAWDRRPDKIFAASVRCLKD